MTIPENIDLGRKGRFGSVNINAFKEGVKKTDLKNAEHIQIFNKFDKDQNGVLSENELQELVNSLGNYTGDGKITRREAGKFLKSNDLKGEMNRKEVFEFLKQFGLASDNIADTTNSLFADGTELINIEYKPNASGEIITDMINNENGILYGKKTVKDGKTVTQYFTEDGKIKQEVTEEGSVKTIVQYDENGNVTSTTRQKGSVTEFLDADGRVFKKETDKGSGLKEIVEYEYDDNGNVSKTTTTNADGTKVIDDGVSVMTINTDGSKTVENKETGEIQEYDKDGKLIEKEDPAEEISEPYKHQTKLGDTWYGIVQAKYGITDHKQTMEIVRQLKAQNNVDPQATNMPKEIILPDIVTLNDGTEVKLTNKDAVIDTSHNNITNANHLYNVKMREEQQRQEQLKQEAQLRSDTITIQTNITEQAKADFEAQLASDGWAGKTADAISVLWGSENRAVKVRADIEAYEQELKALTEANSQGKDAFNAKFKEIYGIDYNSENILAYINNPTDENYAKAFGTENDIARRVEVYNRSQQKGAAAVKTTVVGVASAAAAVATGGASLAATAAVAGASAAAARTAVEVADLATNDVKGDINQQSLNNIANQAIFEGVVTAGTAGMLKGGASLLGKGASAAKSASTAAAEGAIVKASGQGVIKAGTASAGKAGSAAAKTGARLLSDGGAAEAKSFINNAANKVAQGGLKNLSPEETANLAKILGIKPENLANITRKEVMELIKKFHPDHNPDLSYANDITSILTNILGSL